jgi:hypothetical protein
MSYVPTKAERDEFRERATDGGDHEWAWYVDDVPRLLDALDAIEQALWDVYGILGFDQDGGDVDARDGV